MILDYAFVEYRCPPDSVAVVTEDLSNMQRMAHRFRTLSKGTLALIALAVLTMVGAGVAPARTADTAVFVATGLAEVAPLVIPGILLAAWVTASGASGWISTTLNGYMAGAVLVASAIGAITPVCGVTVLPLMAGLLAGGVPLAPVMAFWLSSPVTDPAMFATTAATLGLPFAIGKTAAAFGLGLAGGVATAALRGLAWCQAPLRQGGLAGDLARCSRGACAGPAPFEPVFWRTTAGRSRFQAEALATSRLILICLTPAFAAEYLLRATLSPNALTGYLGPEAWWSIPAAVFVGAPAYLDGYAALPLTRTLMEHGMSPGTAMAFLVSGSVVSIWGALAIAPVLRLKPFLLYLGLALAGSLASGWLYELAV